MISRLFPVTVLLSVMAGCESTGINPRMYSHYQTYLTAPHYRALAATTGSRNEAASMGWSSNNRTVEGAIEKALEGCRKGEKTYIEITKCRLHSIGDIKVADMEKEQVDKAIALYTFNKLATNEDLLKTIGQLPEAP